VCYARVSSHDQKEDVQRQQEWLTKPQNKQFLDKLNEAVTELTDENVTGTQN
jgi:predicted site-specific integrase-resolvase